jgi:hypothetical protein
MRILSVACQLGEDSAEVTLAHYRPFAHFFATTHMA